MISAKWWRLFGLSVVGDAGRFAATPLLLLVELLEEALAALRSCSLLRTAVKALKLETMMYNELSAETSVIQ